MENDKKFEYLQVEYSKYPSPEELNEEGYDGWELMIIYPCKKTFWISELERYSTKEIFIATFKKEIIWHN